MLLEMNGSEALGLWRGAGSYPGKPHRRFLLTLPLLTTMPSFPLSLFVASLLEALSCRLRWS